MAAAAGVAFRCSLHHRQLRFDRSRDLKSERRAEWAGSASRFVGWRLDQCRFAFVSRDLETIRRVSGTGVVEDLLGLGFVAASLGECVLGRFDVAVDLLSVPVRHRRIRAGFGGTRGAGGGALVVVLSVGHDVRVPRGASSHTCFVDIPPSSRFRSAGWLVNAENGNGLPMSARVFRFEVSERLRPWSRLFFVDPDTCTATIEQEQLTVSFGRWSLTTPISNIADVAITGPYTWWKVAGPARLSLKDRGVTFATTDERGVCISFVEPVAAIEPTGVLTHPSLTLTVADVDGFVEALHGACAVDRA